MSVRWNDFRQFDNEDRFRTRDMNSSESRMAD